MKRGVWAIVAAAALAAAVQGCSLMDYCPMHMAMRALTQGGKPDKAAPDAPPQQMVCPVMGGKIDRKVFADHKGTRVYFCCPGCIETFKKDPEEYIAKLK